MNELKYDIYFCGGHWLKIHGSIGVCHKYEKWIDLWIWALNLKNHWICYSF
jgi:hypothetical protein